MSDKLKEQISAFIDNEAYDSDIIQHVESDAEMRATMTRYSLISDVLNNRYSADSYQLSSRVHESLNNEAAVVTPKQWLKKPTLVKQAAGLAIAATVAAVAILVVGDFSSTQQPNNTVVIGPVTDKPIRMTSEVQRKLSGYLVSHTEYSASSRMKGMLPYTRIASFAPGQRIESQSISSNTGATIEK